MSDWSEEDVLTFCAKLIAQQNYMVAEEVLWAASARNRGNVEILALLGRIFEETKQFELALKQYETALVLRPNDENLMQRRAACLGRPNESLERQDAARWRAVQRENRENKILVAELSEQLHRTRFQAIVNTQQTNALRERVWPEIAAAPRKRWKLSEADIDRLTMGGKARFEYAEGSTAETLGQGADFPVIYTDQHIDQFLEMIAEKETYLYRGMDDWVYEALEAFPVAGMKVAVIGSLSPWYESMCIHYGAYPTVVDYTKILCTTARMAALSVDEFYKIENQFDFAISISSIEHDGLGGYQVSLDPDADILAMRKLAQAVKPGGLAIFNVPIGRDTVSYPNARTYGRNRFPQLMEGWEIVRGWNFDDGQFDLDYASDPLFVIRNTKQV